MIKVTNLNIVEICSDFVNCKLSAVVKLEARSNNMVDKVWQSFCKVADKAS